MAFGHGIHSWLFLLCPQVVAFVKSPVGRYLDRHPFVALTLLLFVAVSAVPVGFFLLLVVLTTLAALVGVIVLEGILLSYSSPGKTARPRGWCLWGICHSCQRSLSLSNHVDRGSLSVQLRCGLGARIRTSPPAVPFWTSCLPSLSLKALICNTGIEQYCL